MTQQLDSVEKKSLSDTAFIDYISYFQWFLGIALALLLAEYFLPERRRRSLRLATGMGVLLLFGSLSSSAQKENALIRSGNRYYKQKQVDQSLKQYEDAVKKAPGNPTANYNLGNAQFRKNSYSDAASSYNASVEHTTDKTMQERGLYNKGVALVKQQKLQESIDAWKNALKLDANDEDARENLQKALQQLKQQQQSQQQKEKKDQQDKKDQKDKKDQNKEQEQPQQPKPQPSRLTKQQVEQYLKTLEQKEKDIQDKMNQNKAKAPNQPDKDW
jgi:tetratricopeptide (TPR) repeat protein